jgi:hypothetical protein
VWLVSFFLFVAETRRDFNILGVSLRWYPLSMLVVTASLLVLPAHLVHLRTRLWLAKVIWDIVRSPFSDVAFIHFFVSDILTSMPKFLSDMEYIFCYYISGEWSATVAPPTSECNQWVTSLLPYTLALPLWFRFWQCMRRLYYTSDKEHLANACKYLFSMVILVVGVVGSFNVYQPGKWGAERILWIVFYFFSTCYVLYWDIVMDWGLGKLGSKNFLLRDALMFPRWAYLLVIVLDTAGRFLWAWSLTPYTIPFIQLQFQSMIFGYIEILRRFMWAIFRVENEHLNNCGKYRATLHVPLPIAGKQHFEFAPIIPWLKKKFSFPSLIKQKTHE